MSNCNVLVIFYSREGLTERLAVLLAEGAIQGNASIRLRRSRDIMPEELIAGDPVWKANRDRMHDEFAAPRIQDVEWADVIAFGTPAAPGATGPELATTLAHIGLAIPPETLRGKGATAFTSSYGPAAGAESAAQELGGRLLRLGFVTLPRPRRLNESDSSSTTALEFETARAHGRLVASLGRSLRGWRDRPVA